MMKVYCEHGALSADLRALQRDKPFELVHFPYDPESHPKRIASLATPSKAQVRDLNLTWDKLTWTWGEFDGSAHLPEIIRIIGSANRRDALHIDSAYKTGCAAFVTKDRDILDHKLELEAFLKIRFFDPDKDIEDLRRFISDRCTNA